MKSPGDGRVRVDACVNYANTLSSWAAVETAQGEAGKASELLVAAVEGYRRALEQEEDAAVSPPPVMTALFFKHTYAEWLCRMVVSIIVDQPFQCTQLPAQ